MPEHDTVDRGVLTVVTESMMKKQAFDYSDSELIVFSDDFKGIGRSTIPSGTKAVLFQNNNIIDQAYLPASVEMIVFTDKYCYGIMGVAPKGVNAYLSKGSMTAIYAAQHGVAHRTFNQRPSETPEQLLKRLYAKEKSRDAVCVYADELWNRYLNETMKRDAVSTDADCISTPTDAESISSPTDAESISSPTDAKPTPTSVLLTSERFESLLVKSMWIHAEKIATALVTQIEHDAANGSLHLAKPYHLASFDSPNTSHRMKAILSEFLPADQVTVTYLNSKHSIDMVVPS